MPDNLSPPIACNFLSFLPSPHHTFALLPIYTQPISINTSENMCASICFETMCCNATQIPPPLPPPPTTTTKTTNIETEKEKSTEVGAVPVACAFLNIYSNCNLLVLSLDVRPAKHQNCLENVRIIFIVVLFLLCVLIWPHHVCYCHCSKYVGLYKAEENPLFQPERCCFAPVAMKMIHCILLLHQSSFHFSFSFLSRDVIPATICYVPTKRIFEQRQRCILFPLAHSDLLSHSAFDSICNVPFETNIFSQNPYRTPKSIELTKKKRQSRRKKLPPVCTRFLATAQFQIIFFHSYLSLVDMRSL